MCPREEKVTYQLANVDALDGGLLDGLQVDERRINDRVGVGTADSPGRVTESWIQKRSACPCELLRDDLEQVL